jgi:hypothetical protein
VPAATEEQRDPVAVAQDDHAGGVQATAPIGVAHVSHGTGQSFLQTPFPHQLRDSDRGVVVVQHLALRLSARELVFERCNAAICPGRRTSTR